MGKSLLDMSLEELWELFPISLVPHDEAWASSYQEIEALLQSELSLGSDARISHIGSTVIPNILSKNIVDVLVEIPQDADMSAAAKQIEDAGFICMSSGDSRYSFNMGYTEEGFADKVYHVHLRYFGDNDELYFRDYLLDHPEIAKEYEALKIQLAQDFEHNRDAYTDAKEAFVRKWTTKAKEEYPDRY